MSEFRAIQMEAITAALHPPASKSDQDDGIEAMLCVAATSALARANIPYTTQSVQAIATRLDRELRRQIRRIQGGTN